MRKFNPLNTKLNPICHLLALLGAHHILHVSRIRVKAIQKATRFGSKNKTTIIRLLISFCLQFLKKYET